MLFLFNLITNADDPKILLSHPHLFLWLWNPNISACACMWVLIFSKINSLTLQFLNFVIIFVFVEVALDRSFRQ